MLIKLKMVLFPLFRKKYKENETWGITIHEVEAGVGVGVFHEKTYTRTLIHTHVYTHTHAHAHTDTYNIYTETLYFDLKNLRTQF